MLRTVKINFCEETCSECLSENQADSENKDTTSKSTNINI